MRLWTVENSKDSSKAFRKCKYFKINTSPNKTQVLTSCSQNTMCMDVGCRIYIQQATVSSKAKYSCSRQPLEKWWNKVWFNKLWMVRCTHQWIMGKNFQIMMFSVLEDYFHLSKQCRSGWNVAAFHLDLHCLPKYLFMDFPIYKESIQVYQDFIFDTDDWFLICISYLLKVLVHHS